MFDINDGSKWVRLSVAMSSQRDTMAMVEVQYLCRLNARLVSLEQTLPAIAESTPNADLMAASNTLTELQGQSWLWVLGAYEVFRRAKARLGERQDFKVLNGEISEIRIVLAKQEARARPDSWQRPNHIRSPKNEFGWRYWNRRGEECEFLRAPFACNWLQYGEAFMPPK